MKKANSKHFVTLIISEMFEFQSCFGHAKCFEIKSCLLKTTTVFVLNTRLHE